MINNIIISASITLEEANYIARESNELTEFKTVSTGKKTTELSKIGILDLNVWFNIQKIIEAPLTEENCLINATLDVIKLSESKININQIIKLINSKLPYGFNWGNRLHWKVKSATFVYNFIGNHKATYYQLLRGGYDLTKYRLKKTITKDIQNGSNDSLQVTEYTGISTENSKSPERYHPSFRLRIELNNSTEKQPEEVSNIVDPDIRYIRYKIAQSRLQVKIFARRNKISSICNEFNIPDRNADIFLDNIQKIDEHLFTHYITLITGEGDFYTYQKAEEKIMKSDYTKKEKDKMCDVLKAVAHYKGVSNYLNHVEDKDISYPCMKSVRKRAYALKVLRNIQNCGICPFNISTRTKISDGKLDNLINIYKK